jgi:hypothetical protein
VLAFGEPLLKEGAVGGGLRGRDAAVVEAEGAGLGDEGGFELLRGELGDGRWKMGGQRGGGVVDGGLRWLNSC